MYDDSIGARIKKYRKYFGRTQAQLADDCGVAVNTISQYERGIREPKIRILYKIASVLGVDITDLIPEEWMVSRDA